MAFYDLLPSHSAANPLVLNMLENLTDCRILERIERHDTLSEAIDMLHDVLCEIGSDRARAATNVAEFLKCERGLFDGSFAASERAKVANPLVMGVLSNLAAKGVFDRADAYYLLRDALDVLFEVMNDDGLERGQTAFDVAEFLNRVRRHQTTAGLGSHMLAEAA